MNITEQAAQVLQQIDAALALAEKANTGYVHRKEEPGAVYMGNDLQQQWIEIHSVKPLDDGAFIAASRTLLPASLRCLKTEIVGLNGYHSIPRTSSVTRHSPHSLTNGTPNEHHRRPTKTIDGGGVF